MYTHVFLCIKIAHIIDFSAEKTAFMYQNYTLVHKEWCVTHSSRTFASIFSLLPSRKNDILVSSTTLTEERNDAPMNDLILKPELRQELKLTPQLLQSMEILQMNSQELLEYLNRTAEENPILDLQDDPSLHTAFRELQRKASWLDGGSQGATFTHENTGFLEAGTMDRETESLAAFLRDQLDRLRLPKPLCALSKYLADLVNEDGYLDPEDLDSLAGIKISPELTAQALTTLQSLEPAGVGARNLSECLLLQLAHQNHVPRGVTEIISRFLPELGRKQYGFIAKSLGLTKAEVMAAEQIIANLDPRPGQVFQSATVETAYVRPDVYVLETEGQWIVLLNEFYLPRVSINSYYERLLQDSDEKETKVYLTQKLQQAKWLLNSLERRGATLRRCAEAALVAQPQFFSGESTELRPMSLSSMAADLGIHPSTVSRAIRGKYLQCQQGCFPLKYFFSLPVTAEGPSGQAVRQMILKLIHSEEPGQPLSDQQISRILSRQGVTVARRTVTKYRTRAGIGSSTARRKR